MSYKLIVASAHDTGLPSKSVQMDLLDIPPTEPIRKPAPKPQPATQPAPETIHQTLARYAREAAENRVKLKAEGKI